MIWFSAESALMSTKPERLRADRDAGEQEHRDVGNPDFLRQQAASVPIARISPQDSRVCLAISMEADASNQSPLMDVNDLPGMAIP